MDTLSFPGMHDDETIKLWVHKHWIVHLQTSFGILIFGAAFAYIMGWLVSSFLAGQMSAPYLYLLVILYMLGIWLWGYVHFIDNEFDCLIVTDNRVIDITQIGLFQISFSETSLDLIQDVRDTSTGFIGNILNYGEIEAQTAGASIVFQIETIPNSNYVAKVVQDEKRSFLIRTGRRKEAQSGREHDTIGTT